MMGRGAGGLFRYGGWRRKPAHLLIVAAQIFQSLIIPGFLPICGAASQEQQNEENHANTPHESLCPDRSGKGLEKEE